MNMKFIKKQPLFTFSIVVLLLTTVYWSLLSAIIQQQNSDQLADPALFDNWNTFSQSIFPTQHTFLLKWPIFFIVQLAHGSPAAFISVTVLLSLATVGLFAWILSRIEKRPQVLALLFLALSVVLLLVPIEPKPGSLLPVGMGMLTTRNIEYIVFLGAILLLFQQTSKRIFTPRIIAATLLLTLLFVSDQLFIGLLFGGVVLFWIVSWIFKKKDVRQKVIPVLLAGIAAVVLSVLIVLAMRALGILDSPGNAVGPYGVGFSPKDFALGLIYGVMGILTQFGANPVSGTVIAADLPGALLQSIRSPLILGYLINTGIFIAIVASIVVLIKETFVKPPKPLKRVSKKKILALQTLSYFSLFIVMAAVASIGLFVVTKHYYAVDARYMGLVFFAGFIALTLQVSKMKLQKNFIAVASTIMVIGCVLGMYGIAQSFQESQQAYSETSHQNTFIAEALQHHPVKTLVADYWRVYPIVNETKSKTQPLPLGSCFDSRKALASRLWEQDAYKKSFAYLLTTEKTETGYPACELSKVREAFGSPSDSLVVEGTSEKPKTMLLFYDKGINYVKPDTAIRPDDVSLLRNLSELKDISCVSGQTILQTVAHEDDDLLFMNPDLVKGVEQGDCVRTIYFTAGDAGNGEAYWLGREEGAKAAYARMFGIEDPIWKSRDVQLSDNHQVKIAQLQSNHARASLIFMRLPDGNVNGRGFASEGSESLNKLANGTIPSIASVDTTSEYSKADILAALQQLMNHYGPAVVRTQAINNHSDTYRDHSDHLAVGRLTQEAFIEYNSAHPDTSIQHYIGYPIRAQPANVTDDDLILKKSIFFTYAEHDPSTCVSDVACETTSYRFYLNRQYQE
jgi:LmbE family N-acetylglucosaminyl deacetylase